LNLEKKIISSDPPSAVMAPPPPSSSQNLQDRLLRLVQTLQFAWFAGHVILLTCTVYYSFAFLTLRSKSGFSQFVYRFAFIAAAATYGIVVYKAYRARMKAGKQGGVLTLVTDENVQYLGK
jgi:transmembrane protein 33